MPKRHSHLKDLAPTEQFQTVVDEVNGLSERHCPDLDTAFFFLALGDVRLLFEGKFPGYRASNTAYHDFGHTCSVVVAATRILYGMAETGQIHPTREVFACLLSCLFHDVGLVQEASDQTGTGAKHTVGHEERSIRFMRDYLTTKKGEPDLISDIALCIGCTELSVDIETMKFSSPGVRIMGQVTGTADLLAQIADRFYLEKLLLLFEEFREAGISGYDTPIELLQKTRGFYNSVARKRLEGGCGSVFRHLRAYFQARWNINRDLYAEAIEANMGYIDYITQQCKDDFDCFLRHLRRGGIVCKLYPGCTVCHE